MTANLEETDTNLMLSRVYVNNRQLPPRGPWAVVAVLGADISGPPGDDAR